MLFLFENTLTHYIYIVFYTLINRAHPAHNLGNFYAMSRHATPTATPSPRSEQLHPMSNYTRTASGRTTTATPSPTSRATFTSGTTTPYTRAHTRQAGRGHIPVKSGLTSSISMGNSAVGRLASDENIQNINLH